MGAYMKKLLILLSMLTLPIFAADNVPEISIFWNRHCAWDCLFFWNRQCARDCDIICEANTEQFGTLPGTKSRAIRHIAGNKTQSNPAHWREQNPEQSGTLLVHSPLVGLCHEFSFLFFFEVQFCDNGFFLFMDMSLHNICCPFFIAAHQTVVHFTMFAD